MFNQPYFILIFLIFLAILTILIFALRKKEEITENNINTPEETEKDKRKKIITIIIAIFIAIGFAIYAILRKNPDGSSNTSSSAAFIPIWAAFIPIFAANKKNKQQLPAEKRKIILVLIGLFVLGLGIFIFLFNK